MQDDGRRRWSPNATGRGTTTSWRGPFTVAGFATASTWPACRFIGWDPATEQIRSRVFDSDGGFGQGTWKKKGNRWYIQQSGVLPDGRSRRP